jgi:2-keto-4-pentenoate hydratase/2-oxohepta-3-ene-1,7-dioic acid hydratase in catechol pathway
VATGFKKRGEPIPQAWYEIPAYYKGATVGFIGPEEEILWPSYTDVLDYELELGMVIGRDGYNVKAEDAHKHIFGFTILNDISARDIQKKEMQIRLGPAKGKDFCSIIGPVIVTVDEFNSCEPNLLMTAKVNGVEWSRGYSGDIHFTWAQMIEHVSKDEWIIAGDLFGSGTVGTGCGLELDKWIKPGDVLELEIEKIGVLKNVVGKKRS